MATRTEDEDASRLILGEHFADAQCLLNAEVALVLENKLSNFDEDEVDGSKLEMLQKFKTYVDRFDKYKDQENVAKVRELLDQRAQQAPSLHNFELAALANLGPNSEAEAKSLIKSLGHPEEKLTPEELQTLLEEVASFNRWS